MMTKPLVVVAFGDSTTACREGLTVYPTLLQAEWDRCQFPVQIINAGVRGDHTDRALARFETDVLAHEPQVVILRFGINDAAVDLWASPPVVAPRVPLSCFRTNMTLLVDTLQARGVRPILCTPNPLAWSDETLQLYGQWPYLPEDADGFNVLLRDYVVAIQELAIARAIPLVEVDAAFRKHVSNAEPPWRDLLLDGMHPNDAGHLLTARLLLPLLNRTFTGLT
jgi:lysophospholipase L1-like esterase